MIRIVRKRDIPTNNKEYFKAACTKCGAQFVFESGDFHAEKRLGGARWISCPECGNCIYWSNSYASDIIESLSEKEYNAYLEVYKEEENNDQNS